MEKEEESDVFESIGIRLDPVKGGTERAMIVTIGEMDDNCPVCRAIKDGRSQDAVKLITEKID